MKRYVFLMGVAFLVLGMLLPAGQQERSGPQGAVLQGSWVWQIKADVFFPGAVLPSLLTFHNDGTGACSDSVAFGGIPGNVYRYTPFYGVWERIGPHKFRATFHSLRFNTSLGNMLDGIGRCRATFAFDTDFDHIAGSMHLDFLPCVDGNPLKCPNPLLAQESDWQPWGAISDWEFTGARVDNVPYED